MRTNRSRLVLIAALALVPLAGIQTPAQAGHLVDRTVTITSSTSPQAWDSPVATGANTAAFATGNPICDTPPELPSGYCDVTLLHVNVAPSFWDTTAGGVEVTLTNFRPNAESDFDLFIFESDATGSRGRRVGSSGNDPGVEERFTIPDASGYYLVIVPYFAVVTSQYTGTATLITGRKRFPDDIDSPPGLQEYLASNPALGFKSQSEPHIAQSPLDPDILVAGSKRYNLDRDALTEYEFKIGSYVSFDGGVTWTDLGQLAVCPLSQAPPSSWPNNRCYPEEDPNVGGTGPEDIDDPADPDDPPSDDRGTGDIAEEYVTSDVWMQFDDEGNAYTMVLDHPPFDPSGEGSGWGMTLHRWDSVSAADLAPAGQTWGPRIPINLYADPLAQDLFLDDKNTFAVNNAGPDGDGQTGTMIACWGQNIPALVKQQIVCERSTDGGLSWPGGPQPISGAEQLVIGVHVIADNTKPQTFYATWVQTATNIGLGRYTLEAAKTTDGGQTWSAPVVAAVVRALPRTFPGQSFRNLSIPIMAQGPAGVLYITYAEYLTATAAATDEDGREADIRLVKSTDGGLMWGSPVTVHNDNSSPNPNADQFQPYVAITPSGQVNVAYFDRRLDARSGTHPGNYFVDVWLSRSNDGGGTFTDVRLSHDSSDPQKNAPISPSGLFFGDYQGLVADECHAIPFFNDAHLAQPASRDPNFDAGMPRSPYQEVFAWRVPNTAAYGGVGSGCGADLAVDKQGPASARRGHNFTYSMVVTNNGPADAIGVTLTDNLPKNSGYGTFTTTQGTCTLKPAKRLLTCNLGSLANNRSATVTITVKPNSQGTITNTVSVTAASPNDPVTGNNQDSVNTIVT
jgi:uncharacterized repeat protein (TIGR01451 family)